MRRKKGGEQNHPENAENESKMPSFTKTLSTSNFQGIKRVKHVHSVLDFTRRERVRWSTATISHWALNPPASRPTHSYAESGLDGAPIIQVARGLMIGDQALIFHTKHGGDTKHGGGCGHI